MPKVAIYPVRSLKVATVVYNTDCDTSIQVNITNYYVAVSRKDWELPNSQIWLAEIDIESSLDFPIWTGSLTSNVWRWKSCKLKCKKMAISFLKYNLWKRQKPDEKKSEEGKQTSAELNSAHCHLQAKCQLVETSFNKQIILFMLAIIIINILLTKLSGSVWENLDFSHVYRPYSLWFVLIVFVKILAYSRVFKLKKSSRRKL